MTRRHVASRLGRPRGLRVVGGERGRRRARRVVPRRTAVPRGAGRGRAGSATPAAGAAARWALAAAGRVHRLELPLDRVGRSAAGTPGTERTGRCSTSRCSRCSPLLPWRTAGGGAVPRGLRAGTAGVGLGVGRSPRGPAPSPAGGWPPRSATRTRAPALFVAAFWPAVVLAARRETPWPARGVLLAAASVLLSSSSWPEPGLADRRRDRAGARARTDARAGAARARAGGARRRRAAVAAGAARRLRERRRRTTTREPRSRSGVGCAMLGAGSPSGSLDGRCRPAPAVRGGSGRGRGGARGRALALALALAGSPCPAPAAAPALEVALHRRRRVRALRLLARRRGASSRATRSTARERTTSPRTTSASGAGARSRSIPHSFDLRAFGQTGLVGAALLVGFLAAACLAAARRARREPVAVAALVCAAAWLAHASIDWLWELPALGRAGDGVPRAGRRPGHDAARRGRPTRSARPAAWLAALAVATVGRGVLRAAGAGRPRDRARRQRLGERIRPSRQTGSTGRGG